MTTPLALTSVTRAFGVFRLGPLTLSIRPREYWVLLGPSGCGKSMLLQTIAGFHQPEGRIDLGDTDATRTPPERRNIGLVFQQAALFPHFTVRGNIAYGLEARGVREPDLTKRVDEVVSALNIGAILGRPVASLSGGEAQRVAIARAVAPKPGLLLLDEPLSLLDHNTRLELQGQLKKWHDELGLTTLHVTHSRDEARAVGTHCAIMLGGVLVQAGRVDEVFTKPRCPFVAQFLGAQVAPTETPECAAACLASPSRCTNPLSPQQRRGEGGREATG